MPLAWWNAHTREGWGKRSPSKVWGYGGLGSRENRQIVVKEYKLPVINMVWGCDVQHSDCS